MSAQKNQAQSIFLRKFLQSGAINHVEAHFLSLVVESLNSNSQTNLLSAPAELSIDPTKYLSMNLPPSNFSSLAAFNMILQYLESHQLHYTLNSLRSELSNSAFLSKNSNNNLTNKLELNSHKSLIKQLISKRNLNKNNRLVDDKSKNIQIRAQVARKLLNMAYSGNYPALDLDDIQNHLLNTISSAQKSTNNDISSYSNDRQISSSVPHSGLSSNAWEKDKDAIDQLNKMNSRNKNRYFDSYSNTKMLDTDSNDLQVSSGLPPVGMSSSSWKKKREAVLLFPNADNLDSDMNESLNLSELLPQGLSDSKWNDDLKKSVNKLNSPTSINYKKDSRNLTKNSTFSTTESPNNINFRSSKSKNPDELTEDDSSDSCDSPNQNTRTLSSISIDLSNVMPINETSGEWKQKREDAVKDTLIAGDNFVPIPHKFSSSATSKANSVYTSESHKTDTSSIIPSNYTLSQLKKKKLESIKRGIAPSVTSSSSRISTKSSSNSNSTKLSQLSINEVNIAKATNNALLNTTKEADKNRKNRRSKYSSPSPSVHSNSTFSRDENKSQLEQLKELQKAIDYSDSNVKTNSSSSSSFNFNEQLNKMNLSDSNEMETSKTKSSNLLIDQSNNNSYSYSSKNMPKAPKLVESSEYERIRQELKEKVNKPNEIDGFINLNLNETESESELEEEEEEESKDDVTEEEKEQIVKEKGIEKQQTEHEKEVNKQEEVTQKSNSSKNLKKKKLIKKKVIKMEINDDEYNTATLSSDELKSSTNTADKNSYTTNLDTSTISTNNGLKNANDELLDEGSEEEEFVEHIDVFNKTESTINSTNESSSLGGFQFTPQSDKTRNANLKPVVVATSSTSSSSSSNLKNVILASSSSSSSSPYNSQNTKNNQEEEVYQIQQERNDTKNENFNLEVASSNVGFDFNNNNGNQTLDSQSSSVSSEDNDSFYLSPTQKNNKLQILPNKEQSNKIEYTNQSTDTNDKHGILQFPSEREIIRIDNPIVKKSDSITQTDTNISTPKKRIIKVKKRKRPKNDQLNNNSSDSSDVDTKDYYLPGVNYDKEEDHLPTKSSSNSNNLYKKKDDKTLNFEDLIKSIPNKPLRNNESVHNNESIIIDRLPSFIEENDNKNDAEKVYDLNNDQNTNVVAFEFPDNVNNDSNVVAYEFPENQNNESIEEEDNYEEEKTEIHIDDAFSFQSSSKILDIEKNSPKKVKKIVKKNSPKSTKVEHKDDKVNTNSNSQPSTPKKIIKRVKKVIKLKDSPKSEHPSSNTIINTESSNIRESTPTSYTPPPSLKRIKRRISSDKKKSSDADNLSNDGKENLHNNPSSNYTNGIDTDKTPFDKQQTKEEEKELPLSPSTANMKSNNINSHHSDSSDPEHEERSSSIPNKSTTTNTTTKSTTTNTTTKSTTTNTTNKSTNTTNKSTSTPNRFSKPKNKSFTPNSSPSKSPKIQFASPRVADILGSSDSVIISDEEDDLRNAKPIHLKQSNETNKNNEVTRNITEKEEEKNEPDTVDNQHYQEEEKHKNELQNIEHENDNTVDDEINNENPLNNNNESDSSYDEDSKEEVIDKKIEAPIRKFTPKRKKPANFFDIIERYEAEEAQKKQKEEQERKKLQIQLDEDKEKEEDKKEASYQLINNYRIYTDINKVPFSSDSTFSIIEASMREEENLKGDEKANIKDDEKANIKDDEKAENNQNYEIIEEEEEEVETTEKEPNDNEDKATETTTINQNENMINNNKNEEEDEEEDEEENANEDNINNETPPPPKSSINNYNDLEFKEEEEEVNEMTSIIYELPPNEEQNEDNDNEDSIMNQSFMNIFGKKEKNELKQEQATIELPQKDDENQSNNSDSEDQSYYVALSPRNPLRKKMDGIQLNFNLNPSTVNSKKREATLIQSEEESKLEPESSSEKVEFSDLIPLSPVNPSNKSLTKFAFRQNADPKHHESGSSNEKVSLIDSEEEEIGEEKTQENNEKQQEQEEPYEYVYLTSTRRTRNKRLSSSSASNSHSKYSRINKKKVLTFEEVMERAENKKRNEKMKEIQLNTNSIDEIEEVESHNKSSLQIMNVPVSDSSSAMNNKRLNDSNTIEGILNISSIYRTNNTDNKETQQHSDDSTIDSSGTKNNHEDDQIQEEEEEVENNTNSDDFASSSSVSMFSEEFDKIKNLPISSKHRSRTDNNNRNKRFSDTSFISSISIGESEFNYKEDEFQVRPQKNKRNANISNNNLEENENASFNVSSSFFSPAYKEPQNNKNNRNTRVRFSNQDFEEEELNEKVNQNLPNENSSSLLSTEFKKTQNDNNTNNNNDIEEEEVEVEVEYENKVKFNNQQTDNDNLNKNKQIKQEQLNNEDNEQINNVSHNNYSSSSLFSVEYDKIKDKKIRRNQLANQTVNNNNNNNHTNIDELSSKAFSNSFSAVFDQTKSSQINKENYTNSKTFQTEFTIDQIEHDEKRNQTNNIDNNNVNKTSKNKANDSSFFSAELEKIHSSEVQNQKDRNPKRLNNTDSSQITKFSVSEKQEATTKRPNPNKQENIESIDESSSFSDEFERIEKKQIDSKKPTLNDSSNLSSILNKDEDENDTTNNNKANRSKSILISEIEIESNSENNEQQLPQPPPRKYDSNNNRKSKQSFIESSSFFASLSDDFYKDPPSKFIKKKGINESSDLISEITDGISDSSDEDAKKKDVPNKSNKQHFNSTYSNALNNINNNYNGGDDGGNTKNAKNQSSSLIDSASIQSQKQQQQQTTADQNDEEEEDGSAFSDAFNNNSKSSTKSTSKFVSTKNQNKPSSSSSRIDSASVHSDQQNQEENKQNNASTFSDAFENDSQTMNSSTQKYIKRNQPSLKNSSTISSISGGNSSSSTKPKETKLQPNELSISKGIGKFNPNVSQEASSFFSKNFDKQERFSEPKNQKENDTISSFSINQQENQENSSRIESKSDFLEQISNIDQSQQQNQTQAQATKDLSGDEFVLPAPTQYLEEQKKPKSPNQKTTTNNTNVSFEDQSAHVVVLPHPSSSGKKKRRHTNTSSSINKQKGNKDSINESSSTDDDNIDNEYYYYSDDEKLGDSSCFSFHLRKMARPPKEISSSSIINSNSSSKSPIHSSNALSTEQNQINKVPDEEEEGKNAIDKSSSFSENDFITSPQKNEKSATIINDKNIIKTDNRSRNEKDKVVNPVQNKNLLNPVSDGDAESSDFLFTSEQQKESSKPKNDSLDQNDSDFLSNQKKSSPANDKENNRNSFACTIDDESSIDNISDDDLSIIPKVSSCSLSPNQRSEIALEDLEEIFNEEEEKNIKNVIPVFEEEEEEISLNDGDDDKPKNYIFNNAKNSSSLISTSQINGDNAFGQVKQIKNCSGTEVEGIIEAPSDFDF